MSPTPSINNGRPGPTLAALLLGLMTVVSYLGALRAPFAFDDYIYIVDNPYMQTADVSGLLAYMPARTVAMLSLLANRLLFGLNPVAFRLINLFIHLCCGALVYQLVTLLIQHTRAPARQHNALAILGTGLFLLHPLQVQAVTYVWQRVASLAALFYLLALWLHLKASLCHRDAPDVALSANTTARRYLLAALFAGTLGMLTKQTTFTLPFAIVLFTVFLGGLDALKRDRVLLLSWLPILAIIPMLMVLFGDRQAIDIAEAPDAIRTPWAYFLTQWEAVALYWRLTFVPVGQSVIHDLPTGSLVQWRTWLFGLMHALILLVAVLSRRKVPLVSMGISFVYLALGVESTFVPLVDEVFEHRMYLPMSGVALIVVGITIDVIARSKPLQHMSDSRAGVTALCLVVPLALLTIERNVVWSDPISLWTEAAARAPKDYHARYNSAISYLRAKRPVEAIEHLRAATQARPGDKSASLLLAETLCETGECEASVPLFQSLFRQDAAYAAAPYARTLARLSRFDEALKVLEQAPPNTPDGFLLRGHLLMDAGEPAEALSVLQTAIDSAPLDKQHTEEFLQLQQAAKEARAQQALQERGAVNDAGTP